MTETTMIDRLQASAWHILKTELRFRDKGDDVAADHAHARMMAVVHRTPDPEGTLLRLPWSMPRRWRSRTAWICPVRWFVEGR